VAWNFFDLWPLTRLETRRRLVSLSYNLFLSRLFSRTIKPFHGLWGFVIKMSGPLLKPPSSALPLSSLPPSCSSPALPSSHPSRPLLLCPRFCFPPTSSSPRGPITEVWLKLNLPTKPNFYSNLYGEEEWGNEGREGGGNEDEGEVEGRRRT